MTAGSGLESAEQTLSLLSAQSGDVRERLTQQQFWLFGADIRNPAGNLLLDLGLRRCRATDSSAGSTCYVGSLGDDGIVAHLWGFGCCLTTAETDRVYLARYRALTFGISMAADLERLHTSQELNALRMPAADAQLAEHEVTLFRWFARYERMVQEQIGLDARAAVLDQYGDRRVGAAGEIPKQWERLASAAMRRSILRSGRREIACMDRNARLTKTC